MESRCHRTRQRARLWHIQQLVTLELFLLRPFAIVKGLPPVPMTRFIYNLVMRKMGRAASMARPVQCIWLGRQGSIGCINLVRPGTQTCGVPVHGVFGCALRCGHHHNRCSPPLPHQGFFSVGCGVGTVLVCLIHCFGVDCSTQDNARNRVSPFGVSGGSQTVCCSVSITCSVRRTSFIGCSQLLSSKVNNDKYGMLLIAQQRSCFCTRGTHHIRWRTHRQCTRARVCQET